jgi:hypothetical protein
MLFGLNLGLFDWHWPLFHFDQLSICHVELLVNHLGVGEYHVQLHLFHCLVPFSQAHCFPKLELLVRGNVQSVIHVIAWCVSSSGLVMAHGLSSAVIYSIWNSLIKIYKGRIEQIHLFKVNLSLTDASQDTVPYISHLDHLGLNGHDWWHFPSPCKSHCSWPNVASSPPGHIVCQPWDWLYPWGSSWSLGLG